MKTPQVGDRVSVSSHGGAFTVLAVRTEPNFVDLKLIGPGGYTEKDVPWGALDYSGDRYDAQAFSLLQSTVGV